MQGSARKTDESGRLTSASAEDLSVRDVNHSLADRIRKAAKVSPEIADFIPYLSSFGVELIVSIAKTGRVKSISYIVNHERIRGSAIGPEFTWSGLQKKLGVRYNKNRDIELLTRSASVLSLSSITANFAASQRCETIKRMQEIKSPTLNEIEQSFEAIYERLRDAGNEKIQAEFGRLRDEALDSFSGEFKRIREEELGSLVHTVAPLAQSVELLREDLRKIFEHVDESRHVLIDKIEASTASAENMTEATAHLESVVEQALLAQPVAAQSVDIASTVGASSNRIRQESLWIAFISALIAGLIAALLTGLWATQEITAQVDEATKQIVSKMENQASEDPLRAYFNKIMEKIE